MPSFRKEKQHTIAAIEASTIAHQRAWSFCTADGHHANLEAVTQADANRLSLVTRNEGDIFAIGALRIKIGARGELIGVGQTKNVLRFEVAAGVGCTVVAWVDHAPTGEQTTFKTVLAGRLR